MSEIQEEFELLAKPLIEFLNKNFHLHTRIIVDTTSAELFISEMIVSTMEFVND